MTDKTITVSVRNVYGNRTVYPLCDKALFFCALAGTKTITDAMIRLIRAQGYAIIVEAPILERAA